MVLVDTSVWIDYFRGADSRHTDLLDSLLDSDGLATGDLIITELMQGFRTKRQIAGAMDVIGRLEYFDLAGRDIAFKSADNLWFLSKKGITVRNTIDLVIGTFCIENGIKLLHNDRDFKPMARYLGLQTF